MSKFVTRAAITALALSGAATAAHAGTITGYVYLNQGPIVSTSASIANRPGTPADATFTFDGTANFTGSGNSNVDTINSFLASGGVAPIAGAVGTSILNNTYFYFTGSVGLHAGANIFTVTHDDGLQLNIDGIGLVVDQPGPTAPSATTYTVNAPTAGNYNFELSYGECCGGPAQITVFGGTLVTTPEPGAVALFGFGVAGIALSARRRRA